MEARFTVTVQPLPLFVLDNVGLQRSGRSILSDVSWRVEHGDRWAILGPNGCGKSTLLKLALGMMWPTSGTIQRQGEELIELPAFWRRIGWITDSVTSLVPPEEPARDTVLSGLYAQWGLKIFHGMEVTASDQERATQELDRLGCLELAERPFGVLSQGERQKVLIARALIARPLCLVLDEPCDGMDPGARERFLAWLGRHLRTQTAPVVILVTHHIEEILPEFRQTLILRAGRVQAQGATSSVLTQEAFETLYDTRLAKLEQSAGRLWPIWGA